MSYETDHPTNFNWVPKVQERVTTIQRRHPWKTYVNTYWDHPPDLQRPRRWPAGYYDPYSLDVWGGGGTNQGNYSGYRGKPLPKELGDRIYHELFNAASGPAIDWIIWQGRMWWNPKTGGPGPTHAPPGPPDSDPDHMHHIHCTYVH